MNIEKTVSLEQLQDKWKNSQLNQYSSFSKKKIDEKFGKDAEYLEFSDDYILEKINQSLGFRVAAE